MDIEFHYYTTYLIALKSGFRREEAEIIATSAQMVDDNVEINNIKNKQKENYQTYISQTANILKPQDELFRIYLLFHFVPGDPLTNSAMRKDGMMHSLNTTPNNENVIKFLKKAFESRNFYRIGIAAHAYADSWAHQNFIGYYSYFNGLGGVLEKVIPNIGHADAKHSPDLVSKIWRDERLLSQNEVIDNNSRFLKAASNLLDHFADYNNKKITDKKRFLKNIKQIFNIKGFTGYHINKRILQYNQLSLDISNFEIPEYKKYGWFKNSVKTVRDDLMFLPDLNYGEMKYEWKENYKRSSYYQFCEAVKEHQLQGQEILKKGNLPYLELNKW